MTRVTFDGCCAPTRELAISAAAAHIAIVQLGKFVIERLLRSDPVSRPNGMSRANRPAIVGLIAICLTGVLADCAKRDAQVENGEPADPVVILGDTAGAPPSCSAAAAIRALQEWFGAVASGDKSKVRSSVAAQFGGIVVLPFGAHESLFAGRDFNALFAYIDRRARVHEQLVLQSITFNGWRGASLQFGPFIVGRRADDLGPVAQQGMGKGSYLCGLGLTSLTLGPGG